jgi:uncharacterized protein YidB (DUF937 family)
MIMATEKPGEALAGNEALGGALGQLLTQHGGIGGLLEKFKSSGLGNIFNSWVGTGQNQPISNDQLTQVFDEASIADLAKKLGVGKDQAIGKLSQWLPHAIDKLTPDGKVPAEGALGKSLEALRSIFKS